MSKESPTPWYFVGGTDTGVGRILFSPFRYKDGTICFRPSTPALLVFDTGQNQDPYFDIRDGDAELYDDINSVLMCEVDFKTKRWRKELVYVYDMSRFEKSQYLLRLFQNQTEDGVYIRNRVFFRPETIVLCME